MSQCLLPDTRGQAVTVETVLGVILLIAVLTVIIPSVTVSIGDDDLNEAVSQTGLEAEMDKTLSQLATDGTLHSEILHYAEGGGSNSRFGGCTRLSVNECGEHEPTRTEVYRQPPASEFGARIEALESATDFVYSLSVNHYSSSNGTVQFQPVYINENVTDGTINATPVTEVSTSVPLYTDYIQSRESVRVDSSLYSSGATGRSFEQFEQSGSDSDSFLALGETNDYFVEETGDGDVYAVVSVRLTAYADPNTDSGGSS